MTSTPQPPETQELSLLCKFVDKSQSFTLGFECGQIWAALEAGQPVIQRLAHKENVFQLQLIANAFSQNLNVEGADVEGWCYVSFKERGSTP